MGEKRHRLLAVDDDEAILTIVTEMLGHAGFEVIAAGSSKKALDLIDEGAGPFDVAILDYTMPQMDGLTLALRLRERFPEIRLVMLSGTISLMQTDMARHQDLIDAAMQKPFDGSLLVETVRRLLGESKSEV